MAVIQRLGHVLNYVSLEERLDVVFRPVSPPPGLNGGPEYLSWVIEATKRYVNPESVRKVLRAQLPANVSSGSGILALEALTFRARSVARG